MGLSANANAEVRSDVLDANTMGLWHSAAHGQDELYYAITNGAGAETDVAVTTHALNPGILVAGSTFLWEMWEAPFGISVTNVNYRLSQFITTHNKPSEPSVKLVKYNSQGFATPAAFLAPQCQMSNAADTTVDHFGIGIANIYVTPHTGENDID